MQLHNAITIFLFGGLVASAPSLVLENRAVGQEGPAASLFKRGGEPQKIPTVEQLGKQKAGDAANAHQQSRKEVGDAYDDKTTDHLNKFKSEKVQFQKIAGGDAPGDQNDLRNSKENMWSKAASARSAHDNSQAYNNQMSHRGWDTK